KYFTVSVSGRGVRIESLQDPFGKKQLIDSDKMKKVIVEKLPSLVCAVTGRQVNPAYNASLPNVEVKSVSNPILGHWTLRVTPPKTDSNGKAKHSIRVTGRSKLDFSHAFSTSLGNAYPVEIASNSTRPYLGIPSHLYINQTQSLGTVHYAALTTFEKYSLITARARQLSESGSVFVTDRLEPPTGFFYV
uniref:Dolichyl-diphosphooligosaccharide--protein glycosyltransferase subunit 1 n=1 Tax=Macrostomum lignano TaxID=282301 RepID=A0A1I8IRQ7_9PLAT